MESLEKAQQLLVHHGVAQNRGSKRIQLRLGRQGAVDQQIRDLQEARFLG
jgi:hypothetical protein